MKTEMLMPQMGESIAEATIIRWHKSIGDFVKKDETILEISTDKVDSEIPSPEAGYLVEIKAEAGATVAVKSIIAVIDSEASGSNPAPVAQKAAAPQEQAAPKPAAVVAEVVNSEQPKTSLASYVAAETISSSSQRSYSPLVKNIAAQNGISDSELDTIEGSGANGRVNKEDLLYYIESKPKMGQSSVMASSHHVNSAPAATAPSIQKPVDQTPARISDSATGVKVEPFDPMRKAIAEHMVRSKHTSPHVYSVAEIDVTNIAKWRKREQAAFKEREGFGLSFTPFFLEAVVKGLTQYPRINASVEGESLVIKRDINLGCAVALGDDGLGGLIVPNIKNAGSLNFAGIARGLNDIANRARTKKLKPEDVQGGTFTVTNVGVFGNIIGYPIISQPQLGILALGAIKKRPVVVDDAIAIRDICYITLSYDHRVIDGALGGHFLKYVTDYLQNWDMNRTI